MFECPILLVIEEDKTFPCVDRIFLFYFLQIVFNIYMQPIEFEITTSLMAVTLSHTRTHRLGERSSFGSLVI